MSKIVAVIDIGSNSARMAIFRRTSRFGFHLMLEVKSKVRISEGCYENNGYLQKLPMKRAVNAICNFHTIAKNNNARKIFCVATSALRDAPNKNYFISLVRKQTGINVKVIDGEKEAFYGAIACCNLLHYKSGITIDIGGGSTECAIIENGKILELISLNIGTIRIKELFFDAKYDLQKAKKFIQQELDKLPKTFKHNIVFGIGGTIRTLAKLIMKKEKYPLNLMHGYEFSPQKQSQFFKDIYNSNLSELKKINIPQDREDNIRSGTLIFSMILELIEAKKIITSGVGVREGVFLSDLLRNQNFLFPNNFNPSHRSLIDRFIINDKHQNIIKTNALNLFNAFYEHKNIDKKYLRYIQIASSLSKIGSYLHSYMISAHSAYFILNALNYGYSHVDKVIIYTLMRYANKKIPKNDKIVSLAPDLNSIKWLGFILVIAEALSITNKICRFSYKNNALCIECSGDSYLMKEKVNSLLKPHLLKIEFI